MGLARKYNKVLHKELDIHAAWLPITNNFTLGDFGIIDDGVFQRMGNISDFGISNVETLDGPESSINFSSEGTRAISLSGDIEVPALPEGDIGAKIRLEFSNENSMVIKGKIVSTEMKSIITIANKLASIPAWHPYSKKMKIVSAVYRATDCAVLTTKKKGAMFEISGTANALRIFNAGRAEAGLQITKSRESGLEILGKQGPIGLDMFRIRRRGGVQLETLTTSPTLSNSSAEAFGVGVPDLPDDV